MTAVLLALAAAIAAGATGFMLAAMIASGSREDAYRAGYAAGVDTLVIGEDDQLVLTTDHHLTPEEAERIHELLERKGSRCVVLDGFKVAAIRRDWQSAATGPGTRKDFTPDAFGVAEEIDADLASYGGTDS